MSSNPVVPGGSGVAAAPTSPTPAQMGRVLLIHGYSAEGKDLMKWKQTLSDLQIPAISIEVGNYVTLNNEVTIKDLGEAFDRALRRTQWTEQLPDNWTFDAIVHSTGMLVLRQWLTSDPFPRDDPRSRVRRLKHVIGLAPASFGSPQAAKGRSFLGSLVKGNKHWGPDFLNAGDQVLDGLELASKFTWDLTHKDLLCAEPLFGSGPNTPYVAVFIGNKAYSGIAAVANSPGTDGTVRWGGCSLNTRKVTVDLRREPRTRDQGGNLTRLAMSPWANGRLGAPIIAVDGLDHGSIVDQPNAEIAKRTMSFFSIKDVAAYMAWEKEALEFGADSMAKMDEESLDHDDDTGDETGGAGWQQLVVHMADDHGDGITDFNVQLFLGVDLSQSDNPDFRPVPVIASTYSSDASYRSLYVRLPEEINTLGTTEGAGKKLWMEIIASSGSSLIEYEAYTGSPDDPQRMAVTHDKETTPVKLDITKFAGGDDSLLYPYTTTLLEIFVQREPLPLGDVSGLFNFMGYGSRG